MFNPCPFCGAIEPTVQLINSEEVRNGFHPHGSLAICCSAREGGCGACGGFKSSEQEAIDNWNMRSDLDYQLTGELSFPTLRRS